MSTQIDNIEDIKKIINDTEQKNIIGDQTINIIETNNVQTISSQIKPKNIISISGFNLPIHTLYLIIILLIIGCLIWYFSRKPKNKKHEEKN
jgi:chromate transport protein ChrA